MLITRKHGSWVVLGTLVTEVEVEPGTPLDLDCGSCTLCIEACPTGALDEPGVVDSTKCLSYWTQSPGAVPEPYREELGDQVYGCDICQDVCPWNRGIEKRRAEEAPPAGAEPVVSLVDWLLAPSEELRDRYTRLYFPRNDPRFLRRNALIAAGNSADTTLVDAVRPYAEGDDQLLREHAEWALARLGGEADEL
jgi:epoxyqueuosine reductase